MGERWGKVMGWADPDGGSTAPRRWAILLAYAGLVPVLGAGLAMLADAAPPFDRAGASRAAVVFAAVALAFLGGVRWGMALKVSPRRNEGLAMLAAALPVVVAAAALLLPVPAGLGLLAAGFAGQGAWDVWTVEGGQAPAWYGRLRMRLTIAMTVILVAAFILAQY